MIADGIGDPGMVGASREEQRRRILFALEAPLPPPPAPKVDAAGAPVPRLTRRQARIADLRKSIPNVADAARRMDLTDELRELSRAEREENPPAAPPGPVAASP